MQYFSENDTVAVMEENAKYFRVYHADSMHLKRQYDIKVRLYISLDIQNNTRTTATTKYHLFHKLDLDLQLRHYSTAVPCGRRRFGA